MQNLPHKITKINKTQSSHQQRFEIFGGSRLVSKQNTSHTHAILPHKLVSMSQRESHFCECHGKVPDKEQVVQGAQTRGFTH